MATQYDEIYGKADEMRKIIESKKTRSLPIREKSGKLLSASETVKNSLFAPRQIIQKATRDSELLKTVQTDIIRPTGIPHGKSVKHKKLY